MTNETKSQKCSDCNGTGKRMAEPNDTDKFSAMCPYCAGTGQTVSIDTAVMAKLMFKNSLK